MHVVWLFLALAIAFVPSQRVSSQEAARFNVRIETSRGDIVIAVDRAWAPRGADRFRDLVQQRYYDDARFFRVVAGRWAQFGIHRDPKVSQAWRARTFPDDPRTQSNVRGAVAFAWAVPNGRTTQVFINLGDNSKTLDAQGFAPFGRVVSGMEVADVLYSGYGEESGGGIRAGRQDPLFELGNAYLLEHYPLLDYIRRAIVEEP
jgi:peptidyl-prolyl cis-trans isomerase A (cyclophilin A)